MSMEKVGIVCCSNGLQEGSRKDLQALEQVLKSMGLEPVYSPYLYAQEHVWSGTARQRAEVLMDFYRNEEIRQIFDVSGGDLANGILPDLEGKILLLEALGGQKGQMLTYLSQLQQLGAFEKVRGILLGTFTRMESQGQQMYPLLKAYIPDSLPVAKTYSIGHGTDAKAIRVGEVYRLKK